MIELHFVRHGQTEWNRIRKLQGVQDSPLTSEGIEQTLLLKEHLSHIDFNKCITSPLGRATETAKLLLSNQSLISTDSSLTEMSFGKVEGVEKELFKNQFPNEFFNLWHHADRYDPSCFDGETFQAVSLRAEQFLNSIRVEKAGQKIVVVSHGMILKVIFGVVWKHSLKKFWDDPVPLNTSVTKVVYKKGAFEIVDFSNVSHLSDTEVISYV